MVRWATCLLVVTVVGSLNLIMGIIAMGHDSGSTPRILDRLILLFDVSLVLSSALLTYQYIQDRSWFPGAVFAVNIGIMVIALPLRMQGVVFPQWVFSIADLYWLNLYLICLPGTVRRLVTRPTHKEGQIDVRNRGIHRGSGGPADPPRGAPPPRISRLRQRGAGDHRRRPAATCGSGPGGSRRWRMPSATTRPPGLRDQPHPLGHPRPGHRSERPPPRRRPGDGTVAVVHNGVIENHASLRADLEAAGVEFRSQTDTEVIAHLLAAELGDGDDLFGALQRVLPGSKGRTAWPPSARGARGWSSGRSWAVRWSWAWATASTSSPATPPRSPPTRPGWPTCRTARRSA